MELQIGNRLVNAALFISLLFFRSAHAQIFTFDYLTYSDKRLISNQRHSFSLSTALFWGSGEFDGSGNSTGNNIDYLEHHFYLKGALNLNQKFQILAAIQVGGILADNVTSTSYGDIWLLGKYRFSNHVPIAFRAGFKLGKIGKALWLKQNDWDLGVLFEKPVLNIIANGSVSYRVRGESSQTLYDFNLPEGFTEPGNDLHYRFMLSRKFKTRLEFSIFVLGYTSGDKKSAGMPIADSSSRKAAIGAAITIQDSKGRFYEISLLGDIAGKNDKKGIALVLIVRN